MSLLTLSLCNSRVCFDLNWTAQPFFCRNWVPSQVTFGSFFHFLTFLLPLLFECRSFSSLVLSFSRLSSLVPLVYSLGSFVLGLVLALALALALSLSFPSSRSVELTLVVHHGHWLLICCPDRSCSQSRRRKRHLIANGEAVVQLTGSECHIRCHRGKAAEINALYIIRINIVNGVRRRSKHLIEHDILIKVLHIGLCRAVAEWVDRASDVPPEVCLLLLLVIGVD